MGVRGDVNDSGLLNWRPEEGTQSLLSCSGTVGYPRVILLWKRNWGHWSGVRRRVGNSLLACDLDQISPDLVSPVVNC